MQAPDKYKEYRLLIVNLFGPVQRDYTVCATKDVQANFVWYAKVVLEQTYFSKKAIFQLANRQSGLAFSLRALFKKSIFRFFA